jgi:hypothetical protein
MIYLWLIEELTTRVQHERQVAAVFMAAGSKKVTMPDPDEIRDQFDKALALPPRVVSIEQREWLQVMGLAG